MASLARTGANIVAVMQDWVNALNYCPDFDYDRDCLKYGQEVADQGRAVRLIAFTLNDPRLLSVIAPRLTR